MGMPACRITDQTAHGGIVVLGFPTVLIGFMPASRIGDNHVCPMVTGVVPHVGGPFVLGAMTVLVGNMPQSRVTDMLMCVGPPDIAVKGEPTVLVGMAGMGGVVAASVGMQMSGVSTVTASAVPAGGAVANVSASLQQDGTLKLAASAGSLPPIALQQVGWPDLPAADTINFASVQPVTLPRGTPLSALQDASGAASSYFMPAIPADLAAQVEERTASASNEGKGLVTAVVEEAGGIKAWMGQAANSALQDIPQIWAPPGTLATQVQVEAANAQRAALQAAALPDQEASNLAKGGPYA